MERKNILVLLNSFWNHGAGMSGGDQMLIQVFKRIRNDLGILWCVTSPDGKVVIEKEVPGVTFIVSPKFLDRLNLMVNYVWRALFALRCLLLKPEVVYSGSDFFPDVIPAFLLKVIRPRIRWIQCVFHIYPDWRVRPGSKIKNFIAQYMQRFSLVLARRADVILNINHQVKSHLVAKGFIESRIVINPPGIDLDYLWAIPRATLAEGYDGVFLGRLNPSKGIFDLLEIWSQVVKEVPSARLGIIGGGSTGIVTQLKDAIQVKGLEGNIRLLGYMENDKAFALIKASKVFLFPSREEGFGIAIVEALACGVPVVAWKLEVFNEFFAGMIQLSEVGDFSDYSRKVCHEIAAAKYMPKEMAKRMDKLERFSWESVSLKSLKLLS